MSATPVYKLILRCSMSLLYKLNSNLINFALHLPSQQKNLSCTVYINVDVQMFFFLHHDELFSSLFIENEIFTENVKKGGSW